MRAQLGGLSLVFMSLGTFLLVANLVKELKWLRWMTWAFLGLGGIYVFGRLLPYEMQDIVRKVYQYGSDASLFWVWIIALSASMALFNHELRKSVRLFIGLICGAALYVSLVVTYDWKSGWLPAIVALLAIIWLGVRKLRFFSILGGLLVVLLYFSKLTSFLTGSEDYSLVTRSDAYSIVLDIVKRNPITGLGFANYYWYTPLYSILGYHVTFNSHNNYVDLIAQTGVLGLAAFLLFVAVLATIGWRLLKIVPTGFPRAYVIAALGGLAGTLVAGMLGDWFLPFVYNVGLVGFRSSVFAWLFLGGLIALEQIYPNSPAEVSMSQPDTPTSKLL